MNKTAWQDLFLWRKWIIRNILNWIAQTWYYPLLTKKRYCFRKHINPLHILREEELISTLDFFLFLHSQNGQFLAYILYFLYIFFKDFISIFFWLIVEIAEIIPSDQSVPNPVNVWLRIHWAVIPLLGSVTARLDGSGVVVKKVIERRKIE